MFCTLKNKKICPVFVSKHNSDPNYIMILNGEGLHYLAAKKPFSIIRKNNVKTTR